MKKVLRVLMALALLLVCSVPLGAEAASSFGERVEGMAEVTGVRISTHDDKTRIVVDADKPVKIKTMALSNPTRVVADIQGAWLSGKVKRDTPVSGPFASRVRIAQFSKNVVRVVVETNVGKNNYRVFTLSGGPVPGRVVLDFGQVGPSSSGATVALPDVKKPTQPATKPVETKPSTKPATKPVETKPEAKPTTQPQTKPATKPQKTEAEKTAEEMAGNAPQEKTETERGIDEITGLAGKVIVIDAGHGGNDSGAIGPTGVMEKTVTLNIALRLQKLLEAEGATVYMTRSTDTEVSPKGAKASDIEELQARCDVANNHDADIFISIHNDSFTNGAAKGTTGYYYSRGSAKSRDLADKIRSGVIDQIGTQSRGTQSCNFYVVKHTDMPATLVEVAFISNPEEEKLLNSDDGAQKAAQGIADGIADYFG
ncbi:MAG: N-acetylmuramoyl-L-alanine amidase [Selenomonas sp.]|uniref:N-acetylmuramoyl-L-alanine amidase n=1 Tax=Selenomonas sp. TaxID=2053611 RepID=UPI0025F79F66|nr:N-acetylmuramoyl-L-alanine amidase [Selenomonas sp.]MCI6231269.1 N-acetylmuramoyl-L-alanine amidase [Selenomonas sp.]